MNTVSIKLHTHVAARKLLFLLFSSLTCLLIAQEQVVIPAPVGQMRIAENGELMCQMHSGPEAAALHSQAIAAGRLALQSKTSLFRNKWKKGNLNITVVYQNFDPTFTANLPAAIEAFESAVDDWSKTLRSDVPIVVLAAFQPLEPGLLASSGPTSLYSNFEGLQEDTWYGNALADKLAGMDLEPTQPFDIVTIINTNTDDWYFGTDGEAPLDKFDFKTVIVHELCHGLNFFGSTAVDNASGVGSWGFGLTPPNPVFPGIYDRIMFTSDRRPLLWERRYPNFSTTLGDVLLGPPLIARSFEIFRATRGRGIQIFTIYDSDFFGDIPGLTDIWVPGSSYSHTDLITYGRTDDGLMTPFIPRGVSYEITDITLAILKSIGWNGWVRNRFRNRAPEELDPTFGEEATFFAEHTSVFPNPFERTFTVQSSTDKGEIQDLRLTDASGKQIGISWRTTNGPSTVQVDVHDTDLVASIYLLNIVYTDDTVESLKMIHID